MMRELNMELLNNVSGGYSNGGVTGSRLGGWLSASFLANFGGFTDDPSVATGGLRRTSSESSVGDAGDQSASDDDDDTSTMTLEEFEAALNEVSLFTEEQQDTIASVYENTGIFNDNQQFIIESASNFSTALSGYHTAIGIALDLDLPSYAGAVFSYISHGLDASLIYDDVSANGWTDQNIADAYAEGAASYFTTVSLIAAAAGMPVVSLGVMGVGLLVDEYGDDALLAARDFSEYMHTNYEIFISQDMFLDYYWEYVRGGGVILGPSEIDLDMMLDGERPPSDFMEALGY